MKTYFDHEKLKVYQESIRFVAWASTLLDQVPKSMAARNIERGGRRIMIKSRIEMMISLGLAK